MVPNPGKAMNSKLHNIQKGGRREAAKQAGAYDGRFSPRVYTDMKKEASRMACRTEVNCETSSDWKPIERSSHRL